jgi:hypothetical protein
VVLAPPSGMLLGTDAQNTIRSSPRLSRDHTSQIAVVSLVTCSTIRKLKSDIFFYEFSGDHLVGIMFETIFCVTNPIVKLIQTTAVKILITMHNV